MIYPASNNRQHCKRHQETAQLKDEHTISKRLLPKIPPSPTKQPPLKLAEV